MATVTAIIESFTNTGRFPYALAKLSCGHVARVSLRRTFGRCCGCGAPCSHEDGQSFKCCPCGVWHVSEIDSPHPHKDDDRLTKIGDALDCGDCTTEAQQAEWLRGLDVPVHHARFRYGSYHLYRHDPSSPSSFMLIGSVSPTPIIEAILRERRLSPLSPTEAA